jgi:hypothetical protein
MNKECKKINRNLVAFLYGELDADTRERVQAHLNSCPSCREEFQKIEAVGQAADSLSCGIEEAVASVDWDALPTRISESVFDKGPGTPQLVPRRSLWEILNQASLKPVYAALLVGLVLGSLATLFVMRTSFLRESRGESFFVSQEFLDRVELEMARRDTLDYLEKSQYVLLDFVQASPGRAPDFGRHELASQAAQDLLTKKKYINPQLDKFRMAKAKEICDQIEFLFFELTQVTDQLSEEDLQNIQNLIEEKQLLLKIKLLKKELEESEV